MSFTTAYALAKMDSKVLAHKVSGTYGRDILLLVHPLSAIPGSTMTRDFVLIVLKIKLVVVGQLR